MEPIEENRQEMELEELETLEEQLLLKVHHKK